MFIKKIEKCGVCAERLSEDLDRLEGLGQLRGAEDLAHAARSFESTRVRSQENACEYGPGAAGPETHDVRIKCV